MLKIKYYFQKKTSRIELLIRIPYMIILYIIRTIYRSFIIFFLAAQIIHIILRGEKNFYLSRIISLFVLYDLKATAYLFLLTDERPRLFTSEKPQIKRIERKKEKQKRKIKKTKKTEKKKEKRRKKQ